MIGVSKRTLENWEQGRRHPTGPAKAPLRILEADPKHALKALRHQTLPTLNWFQAARELMPFLRAQSDNFMNNRVLCVSIQFTKIVSSYKPFVVVSCQRGAFSTCICACA